MRLLMTRRILVSKSSRQSAVSVKLRTPIVWTEKTGIRVFRRQRLCSRNEKAVTVGRENIEEVQSLNYIGSTVNADDDIMEEVNIRIGKAAGAFKNLRNIWKSMKISRRTKIRLYISNVRSVLLYRAETYRQIESNETDREQGTRI